MQILAFNNKSRDGMVEVYTTCDRVEEKFLAVFLRWRENVPRGPGHMTATVGLFQNA